MLEDWVIVDARGLLASDIFGEGREIENYDRNSRFLAWPAALLIKRHLIAAGDGPHIRFLARENYLPSGMFYQGPAPDPLSQRRRDVLLGGQP